MLFIGFSAKVTCIIQRFVSLLAACKKKIKMFEESFEQYHGYRVSLLWLLHILSWLLGKFVMVTK